MQINLRLDFLEGVLLPFVLILGSKYLAVFLLNFIFSLNWGFSLSASQVFSLPFIQYLNYKDLLIVNSASSIFMTMVLTIGYSVALYRFQFFHENFIEPKVSAKLHSKKMEYLIFPEVSAHRQMAVWFILAWITFLLILLEFLAGSVILLALATNFIIVGLLTSATVVDMHKKGSRRKASHR